VNVNVELDHSSVLSLAPALLLPVGAGAGVLEQAFQMVSYLEHSVQLTILPTNHSSNQLFFRTTIIPASCSLDQLFFQPAILPTDLLHMGQTPAITAPFCLSTPFILLIHPGQ